MRVLWTEERDTDSPNGELDPCCSWRSSSMTVGRLFILILVAACTIRCAGEGDVIVGAASESISIENGGVGQHRSRVLMEIGQPDCNSAF